MVSIDKFSILALTFLATTEEPHFEKNFFPSAKENICKLYFCKK
jgi:hypothetical protein